MKTTMKYQVKSIDYQDCKEWFLKKHYAKRMPSISFCFGLYSDKLEGVCSYGKPASPNLCESICGVEHKEMVYELNRLVVNDGLAKNTLSYFVSQTLKLLSKKLIIVSFADANQGHQGYIYQATNWIYTGLSSNTSVLQYANGDELHFRKFGHNRNDNSLKCKLIKFRTNDKQLDRIKIATYLRDYKGNWKTTELDKLFGYKDTVAHWFRLDKGFSFPKVDDWFKLKEILQFDETYDILMNKYILVPDRQEQIYKSGLKSVEILPKHRYVYFTDNKKYFMKKLKYKIQPYPKGDNKRYDSSYQPTTQTKLL